MKAIMLSVRPKWVSMILNRTKTIEVRKRFPKDYVGWVYIYCTKITRNKSAVPYIWEGKVIARFWCDKVEEILSKENGNFYTNFLSNRKLLTQSCLAQNELRDYMAGNWKQKFYSYWYGGYAIHITKLEIFDKPKEISEFNAYCKKSGMECLHCKHYWTDDSAGYSIPKCSGKPLTRAPQSWCFIEV